MGPLRSVLGRMEMPCRGRGPWAPFQAFLHNLTKVSGQPHPHTCSLGQPCALITCSSWHLPSWPTGILKKKCLPTISEKSSLLRLPLEQGTASSRGSSASEGSRGGPPPRPPPRQSLQEQLNGVMPIAMSIKAGTVDEDSSGSE